MSVSKVAKLQPVVDGVVTVARTLKDIAENIVCSLGNFITELRDSSANLEKLSYEIKKVNVSFAMRLQDFSQDLKLLQDYYTRVYIKTKAMVEFGKVIPHIKTLIEKEEYIQAHDAIIAFLKGLATQTEEILCELGNYQDKMAISSDLETVLEDLTNDYEEAKHQLEGLVEKERKAVCYRLGKRTTLLGLGVGGFLIGSNCKVEQIRNFLVTHDLQLLSFITEEGIKGLHAMESAITDIDDVTKDIERNARNMSDHIFKFYKTISDFQTQITIIVDNVGNLKEAEKKLHVHLPDKLKSDGDQPDGKSVIQWQYIAATLVEIFELFKNLEKEVVQKEIDWKIHSVELQD